MNLLREIIVTDAEVMAGPPGSGYSAYLLGTGALADPRKLRAVWTDPRDMSRHFLIEQAPVPGGSDSAPAAVVEKSEPSA